MINTITTGDARELSRAIPDESIDLIFTDPPYLKEYLPLYDWLGREACRVLKPGGFLMAYAGQYWKDQCMLPLCQHLTYFWDYIVLQPGHAPLLLERMTAQRHKSLLCFVKGYGKPRHVVWSYYTNAQPDKRFHAWGQSEGVARYYIDAFSSPGALVWEPFCGGGTTPYTCRQIGRNCIAFEVDPGTATIARKRLETVQPLLMPESALQLPLESEVAG